MQMMNYGRKIFVLVVLFCGFVGCNSIPFENNGKNLRRYKRAYPILARPGADQDVVQLTKKVNQDLNRALELKKKEQPEVQLTSKEMDEIILQIFHNGSTDSSISQRAGVSNIEGRAKGVDAVTTVSVETTASEKDIRDSDSLPEEEEEKEPKGHLTESNDSTSTDDLADDDEESDDSHQEEIPHLPQDNGDASMKGGRQTAEIGKLGAKLLTYLKMNHMAKQVSGLKKIFAFTAQPIINLLKFLKSNIYRLYRFIIR